MRQLNDNLKRLSGSSVELCDALNIHSRTDYQSAIDMGYAMESDSGMMSPDGEGLMNTNKILSNQDEDEEVEAINDRFNDDLERYENGELEEKIRFELGKPSKYLLSAGFPNLPISMRQALLSKKAAMDRPKFSSASLHDFVKAIQKPLAIFEYNKPNMRNLIVDLTEGGQHFLVGVTLNYKAGETEINSVCGLFPKDNTEWLKWIQSGKANRIDGKEKIQAIIDSQRTTNTVESERIGLNLDSVAKVVKNFENQQIPEETLLIRYGRTFMWIPKVFGDFPINDCRWRES